MKGLLLIAALAATPAFAAGDATRGKAAFSVCQACHSVTDEENELGPKLKGVVGRKAATTEFDYSPQLKASGITWDEASLDHFLTDPQKAVPGTRMAFPGEPDAQKRADIIAYLKSFH